MRIRNDKGNWDEIKVKTKSYVSEMKMNKQLNKFWKK